MLFPLSKAFSSTHVFHAGGGHSERAPPSRSVTTDHAARQDMLADKVRDLHKLTMAKKHHDHHVALARTYSEPARFELKEHAKAHAKSIRKVGTDLNDQAKYHREVLTEEGRQRDEAIASAKVDRARKFSYDVREFPVWKDSMHERTATLPYVWGPDHPQVAEQKLLDEEDNVQRRQMAVTDMKTRGKFYYGDRKKRQAILDDSIQVTFKGEHSDARIAQKKADGLRELNRLGNDWQNLTESKYALHHERIGEVMKGHRERHEEWKEKTLWCPPDKEPPTLELRPSSEVLNFKNTMMLSRGEAKARDKKIAAYASNKNHGGYAPIVKSSRRLRDEEALGITQPEDATPTREMSKTATREMSKTGSKTGSKAGSGQEDAVPE